MPWFQSSEEKELRLLIERNIRMCFESPKRYQQGMNFILTYIRSSNQRVIEIVVDKIKQTIKDGDKSPLEKYQAILLLKDLMQTHNKALGKYVVEKILKRLTIIAQHKKHLKNQDRGKDIFGKCKKKGDEIHCINFLNTLLLGFEDWGRKWKKEVDGPQKEFHEARNQLLMGGVTFPKNKTLKPDQENMQNFQESKNPSTFKQSSKKKLIQKQMEHFFCELKETLTLFHHILEQNPQFGQSSWSLTKQITEQIRVLIEKGNNLVIKLINEDSDIQPFFLKIFQRNSIFFEKLNKNIQSVRKKNENYQKFRTIELKESKEIINSLYYLSAKQENSFTPQVEIEKKLNSLAKVEQLPTQQKNEPKIKEKNTYSSTYDLQIQLDQMKKDKQQFRTENYQSNKLGSFSPNVFDQNRPNSTNKKTIENEKQASQKQSLKRNEKKLQVSKEAIHQNQNIFKGELNKEVKQFSEKSQENKRQKNSQFSESKKQNNSLNIFNTFQKQKGKDISQSSDLFRNFSKKQQKCVQKQKQYDDPFNLSIKSKIQDQNLSVFAKKESSKRSSKGEINENIKNLVFQQIGFDSFIKKTHQSVKQAIQNPFEISRESNTGENPFQESFFNNSLKVLSEEEVKSSNKQKISNPFSQKSIQKMDNSFQFPSLKKEGSKISNPFNQKSISAIPDNPFQKQTSSNENPFEEKIRNRNVSINFESNLQTDYLNRTNSFKSTEKVQIQKKPYFSMDNQFQFARGQHIGYQIGQQKRNFQKKIEDPLCESGLQVNSKKESIKNKDILAQRSQANQSVKNIKQNGREKQGHQKNSINDFQVNFQEKSNRKSFDFEDFANFNKNESNQKQNKPSRNNFDDFQHFSKKQSSFFLKSNKQKSSSQNERNLQNNQKKKEFNFSDFDWDPQKQSLFESNKNYVPSFEQKKPSLLEKEDCEQQQIKQNLEKLVFMDKIFQQNQTPQIDLQEASQDEVNWNNFGIWNSNGESEVSNNEQNLSKKEKEQINQLREQNKDSVSAAQQEFEYSQFEDISENGINKISPKDTDIILQIQNPKLRNISLSENKKAIIDNPEQQQKSTKQLDLSPSAFKKKGIKWATYFALPVLSHRNKVSHQQLQRKRTQYEIVREQYQKKKEQYQVLKNAQNKLQEQYKKKLEKESLIRQQNSAYSIMAERLKQQNEIKEKQITQLLKRIKKGLQIQKGIVQKQKLLFNRSKLLTEQRTEQKIGSISKWQRFNKNLQKRKRSESEQSRFSSYGSRIL